MVNNLKKKITYKKLILPLFILGLLIYTYRSIFFSSITSAGDLPYYWNFYIKELTLASLWNPHWPTGLGGNQSIVLPLKLYFQLPIVLFAQPLQIPWEIVQRIVFFWVFFVLAIYSSYRLTRSWIGSLIYASNTWILMVFSGGQIGVALGYSIAPLVLFSFIQLIEKTTFRTALVTGLVLALQFLFDIRIMYVTLIAVGLYMLLHTSSIFAKKNRKRLPFFLLPFLITGLLHSFWLLPLFTTSQSSLSPVSMLQPTLKEVIFFSFATFPNTIGFLHPNWPENIFGKIGFMKPEFLVLPILAYASLLFTQHKKVLFFALLGLLGAFLAKGANEPFGQLYLWLFENVPGFNLFRDPTKFYVLIALAYSFLIPQTLIEIKAKFKKHSVVSVGVIFLVLMYWLMLIRPVFLNELGGLFKAQQIPQEYIQVKDYLESQKQFSRTLWIPQSHRFSYFSDKHPQLNGTDLAKQNKTKDVITYLKKKGTLAQLQHMSVKYVIIPYDSNGEIFIHDGKYDEKKYRLFVNEIKKLSWLKEEKRFGSLMIFAISSPKDHFWIESREGKVSYEKIDPTRYRVSVKQGNKGDTMVFSENYAPDWEAKENNNHLSSKPFANIYNSFVLPREGNYIMEIVYKPQQWVTVGLWISVITLVAVCILLIGKRKDI